MNATDEFLANSALALEAVLIIAEGVRASLRPDRAGARASQREHADRLRMPRSHFLRITAAIRCRPARARFSGERIALAPGPCSRGADR
jgi:hypothetical protein